jgi:hypothetical protein
MILSQILNCYRTHRRSRSDEMKNTVVTGIMYVLLLTSMLTLVFDVASVEAVPEGLLLVETDKDVYGFGESINITVTNVGNVSVSIGGLPSCSIFTYPDLELVWPKWFFYLSWGLPPEESETWIWDQYNEYTNSSAEPGTYLVNFTGVLETPAEFNEAFFEIAILGDINCDGIIDIIDILEVAAAFGTKPGHLNWNTLADLNQDGNIDIFDLVMIGIHFGEKW